MSDETATENEAPDAIVVFHPHDPDALTPFLDLDEDDEESEGLYAEALDDGTFLVHTFQPFDVFAKDVEEAHRWLEQFGDALPDIHDDPRGLLFFPNSHEPSATTYDGVVAEMADKGVFVTLGVLESDLMGGIDMNAIQDLAGQLMGGNSFEVGRMMEGVQKQLAEALGLQLQPGTQPGEKPDVIDAEFEPQSEKKK